MPESDFPGGGRVMNIFDLAMEMELEVKAYYEKLAAGTGLPGVAKIFTLLAGDEQKHHDAVRAMKNNAAPEAFKDTTVLEFAKGVVAGYVGDASVAAKLKNDLQGYRHALDVEAASVRMYQQLVEKETDREVKKTLARILEEEKKHYNIVENLYDFALKPEYFLAWGEFSNLREL
jgi:rubrerythrin